MIRGVLIQSPPSDETCTRQTNKQAGAPTSIDPRRGQPTEEVDLPEVNDRSAADGGPEPTLAEVLLAIERHDNLSARGTRRMGYSELTGMARSGNGDIMLNKWERQQIVVIALCDRLQRVVG